jgi:dipeptidyl aminopeptidase/acylaminoacyl peptidase
MTLPDLISVEQFFTPAERALATISPDGARIAFLAPWKNRLNIWVQDVDADFETEPRRVTADETRSVLLYHWTDDPRRLLYLQDSGGDENWHLYRVDVDAPEAGAVDLTPFPGARVLDYQLPVSRPGKVVLQVNARDAAVFDVLELDIATGEFTVLAQNPGHVTSWLPAGGELFARTETATGGFELSRWEAETGRLHRVVTFEADMAGGTFPFQVTPDGKSAWIGSNRGTDRTRLVRLDLATGTESEVDDHPMFDIDARARVFPTLPEPLVLHPSTGELLGVRYFGARQVIHALDPHFADVLPHLEELSDGDLATISCDHSGQRWVVSFTDDRTAGVTWFYDHATSRRQQLFRASPHLDPDAMAPMVPVDITARDGLRLPSYLTLPVGVEPRGLPMVLLVHGGPWTRDYWGFDPSVQLFANRGYAVLQVNFRGSTGFGKAHTEAAIGEFAGAMHDDLIDAVDWAVEKGYADPERVAIFGGSYGGYAALVGITFTPDVFAAAFEYVGFSSLVTFLRSLPEFVKPALGSSWYRYVGDPDIPDQEADMLARSPISRVDQIRTPLMVVQGANDTRVARAESDTIVESLRARGVDVEYILFDDEGHLFSNPENLVWMFAAAERFLAKHLGGRDDHD